MKSKVERGVEEKGREIPDGFGDRGSSILGHLLSLTAEHGELASEHDLLATQTHFF